jgi:hypothetical protein
LREKPATTFSLLEYVKADGLDIRGPNAKAVAFLLSDLRHAEVFGIRILDREAMGLLLHQAIKAGGFSLDSLRLTASGILRVSA